MIKMRLLGLGWLLCVVACSDKSDSNASETPLTTDTSSASSNPVPNPPSMPAASTPTATTPGATTPASPQSTPPATVVNPPPTPTLSTSTVPANPGSGGGGGGPATTAPGSTSVPANPTSVTPAGTGGGTSLGQGGMDSTGGGAPAPSATGGSGNTPSNASCDFPDLQDWPDGVAPEDVGPRLVTDYLSRTRGDYHYADACAWYGSLKFTELTGDTTNNAKLVSAFDQFLTTSYFPAGDAEVDSRVGGIVPLELKKETGDDKYLMIPDKSWDDSYNAIQPMLKQFSGTNIDGQRGWSDDMFMIIALQVQASRATGDTKYRDLAAQVLVDYASKLQQSNGLMWHNGYSHVHWGRANGWFAVGMAETMQDLPDGDAKDAVMTDYLEMMNGLKAVQIPDGQDGAGLWRQVLDYDQAWFETSCSAMFTYSMATGIKSGWLDAAEFGPIVRKAWIALVGQIGSNGQLQNICEGTGQPSVDASNASGQRDFYMGRMKHTGDLHGQAPVLWSAHTLLRDFGDCAK